MEKCSASFHLNNQKIEEAKKVLKENGYYVDMLWHISDVYNKDGYVTKEGAYEVLDIALKNKGVIEDIEQCILNELQSK